MNIIVREEISEDLEFLNEMRYEAVYIIDNKPSKSELLSQPNIRKYFDNWGRNGDKALIATTPNGEKVGAVWYRLFSEEERGYGYVDQLTPELGIGVTFSHRGLGIGKLLMRSIIQVAMEEGFRSLSLSVDSNNKAAIELYKKTGFRVYNDSGSSWTMLLNMK